MKVLIGAHVHVPAIIRHALPVKNIDLIIIIIKSMVKNRQITMVLVVYNSDFIIVILHTISDKVGQMNMSMPCLYKAILARHLVKFLAINDTLLCELTL